MRIRLLEGFFVRATVGAVTPAGRFRYVRLHSPQFKELAWTPGQQIRLDCGPATALTPLLRTYSVWDHADEWIDLCRGVAYVAGVARTIQAVRNAFVHERRWPRKAIRTKPFWTPGKRGLE
jgi:NADPH-dependent ferric siderophore reductase